MEFCRFFFIQLILSFGVFAAPLQDLLIFSPSSQQKVQVFFNVEQPIFFKKLSDGTLGSFNPPILVFYLDGDTEIPLGVLKSEQDKVTTEKRVSMLDRLREQGCDLIPRMLRSQEGSCWLELEGEIYSCLEYMEPDEKKPLSFEQMLQLTSQLHTYLKKEKLPQSHFRRALDYFREVDHFILEVDPRLIEWDPSLFESASWKECVRYAEYFLQPEFGKIYDRLPAQVIHGDIVAKNIVFSSGRPYFIDLESMRTDVRLRDMTVFARGIYLDHFLLLLEKNELEQCLEAHYGSLEKEEVIYLPVIIILDRCAGLAWSLDELVKALSQQDAKQIHRFREMAMECIHDINKLSQSKEVQRLIPITRNKFINSRGVLPEHRSLEREVDSMSRPE